MEIARKIYYFLLDTAQTFLIAAAIFLVVYIALFRPFEVQGESMYPNFYDSEYVLTNLIGFENFGFYQATFGTISYGDVIVFSAPPDPDKDYIKRVIGLPGDTILIREGKVYKNNKLLDESKYLRSDIKTFPGTFLQENTPITVPNNEFFVLGDNRTLSSDSREWGFVKKTQIVGKSGFVYWPLSRIRFIENPVTN